MEKQQAKRALSKELESVSARAAKSAAKKSKPPRKPSPPTGEHVDESSGSEKEEDDDEEGEEEDEDGDDVDTDAVHPAAGGVPAPTEPPAALRPLLVAQRKLVDAAAFTSFALAQASWAKLYPITKPVWDRLAKSSSCPEDGSLWSPTSPPTSELSWNAAVSHSEGAVEAFDSLPPVTAPPPTVGASVAAGTLPKGKSIGHLAVPSESADNYWTPTVVIKPTATLFALIGGRHIHYEADSTPSPDLCLAVQYTKTGDARALSSALGKTNFVSSLSLTDFPRSLAKVQAMVASGNLEDIMIFSRFPSNISFLNLENTIRPAIDTLTEIYGSSAEILDVLEHLEEALPDDYATAIQTMVSHSTASGWTDVQMDRVAATHLVTTYNVAITAWQQRALRTLRDRLAKHWSKPSTLKDGSLALVFSYLDDFEFPDFSSFYAKAPAFVVPPSPFTASLSQHRDFDRDTATAPAAPSGRGGKRGRDRSGPDQRDAPPRRQVPGDPSTPASGHTINIPRDGTVPADLAPFINSNRSYKGVKSDLLFKTILYDGTTICGKFLLNGTKPLLGCTLGARCTYLHWSPSAPLTPPSAPTASYHAAAVASLAGGANPGTARPHRASATERPSGSTASPAPPPTAPAGH
jgi:hypothetical protein